jgi:hypothetical protein
MAIEPNGDTVNYTNGENRPREAMGVIPMGSGDARLTTTRRLNKPQATRTAIGAASSAAVALGTLGPTREVLFAASSRCFVRFGGADVVAAAATDPQTLVIEAGEKYCHPLEEGETHFRVIRDSVDGSLSVYPVLS